MIVGSHHHDTNGASDAGAAYVFTRTSGGAWEQQAKLIAADPSADDTMGWAVAISGDTVRWRQSRSSQF